MTPAERGTRWRYVGSSSRSDLVDLAAAEAAVTVNADYDNCHQLHGEVDWRTPAERFHGTSFTGRVVASMPALAAVADILGAIRAA